MAEKKYYDLTFDDGGIMGIGSLTTDGQMWSLSTVSQGTADNRRIGDKITMNSIEIRMVLYADKTVKPVEPSQFYRFIVFKWYDDTTPTVGDIIENTGSNFVIVTPLQHDKKVKRKVFLDTVIPVFHDVKPTGYVAADSFRLVYNMPITRTFFIDLKKKSMKVRQVNYEGGTVTGVGKFYILVLGSTTATNELTDPVHYSVEVRNNFTDM